MNKEENEKRLAYLKNIVASLPDKPGTYQYYDQEHTIIQLIQARYLLLLARAGKMKALAGMDYKE